MGWREAGEAEKFEFVNVGDHIMGKLIDMKTTRFDSKVYTILDCGDNTWYFFGCYKLDSMLPKLVGRFVNITYKGKVGLKNEQTLREFSIGVWADEEGKPPEGFVADVPF